MKTIAQQLNVKDFPFIIKDKNGNPIYLETSNGYWEKYEYDSKGNQIYFDNSDGRWIKRKYDSNGNEIYFEDSGGYWEKYEYDSNENQIYYGNSDGYWRKREFDSNGNVIYYEDSEGDVKDNRPKQNCEGKVVEIDGKKYQLKEDLKSILEGHVKNLQIKQKSDLKVGDIADPPSATPKEDSKNNNSEKKSTMKTQMER